MSPKLIEAIIIRWKITQAFALGLASSEDHLLWDNICSKSHFHASLGTYTSTEKTYLGMMDNFNYFTDNCSIDGLILYISFYEQERGIPWKELYFSNINTHNKKLYSNDNTRSNLWWEEHLALFS